MKRTPVTCAAILLLLLASARAGAQSSNIDDLYPVSPTAWQVTKYADMPVSKYTVIPDFHRQL